MALHYCWYGILLIMSHYAFLIHLWFWELPFCLSSLIADAFVCYSVIQITRLAYVKYPLSVTPLYISFIPYSIFHLLAREFHLIFSILWFISMMAINLQLGSNKLRIHIFLASITYVGECYSYLSPLCDFDRGYLFAGVN